MTRARALLALIGPLVAGCGGGLHAPSGLDEPLRVTNGQFFEGDLPTGSSGPAVLNVSSQNNLIPAGETGKKLSGLAAAAAYAVALRFADAGSGYWVVPVGAPDPQTDGELTWEAVCDIARNAPEGKHTIVLSADDGAGHWGPRSELPVLVQSFIPEGHVVLSLTWDVNADLDLHVVTPSGKEVDPKHPSTALDAGVGGAGPSDGVLDLDSNAACTIDGVRREDLVWSGAPDPGRYLVRVDMWSACGEPAASFRLDLYVDGERRFSRGGTLLDIDADGGGPGSGLFVAELDL